MKAFRSIVVSLIVVFLMLCGGCAGGSIQLSDDNRKNISRAYVLDYWSGGAGYMHLFMTCDGFESLGYLRNLMDDKIIPNEITYNAFLSGSSYRAAPFHIVKNNEAYSIWKNVKDFDRVTKMDEFRRILSQENVDTIILLHAQVIVTCDKINYKTMTTMNNFIRIFRFTDMKEIFYGRYKRFLLGNQMVVNYRDAGEYINIFSAQARIDVESFYKDISKPSK